VLFCIGIGAVPRWSVG